MMAHILFFSVEWSRRRSFGIRCTCVIVLDHLLTLSLLIFSSEGNDTHLTALRIHDVPRDWKYHKAGVREGACVCSSSFSLQFLASPTTPWLVELGSSLSISLDKKLEFLFLTARGSNLEILAQWTSLLIKYRAILCSDRKAST